MKRAISAVFAAILCFSNLLAGQRMAAGSSGRHLRSEANETSQSARAEQAGGLEHARSLLEVGKIIDADRAIREFLEQHADSADGHFLLGYILFREIQLHGTDPSTLNYAANAVELKFREANAKASLAEYTEGAKYRDPSAFDLKIVAFDYILIGDSADADKWLTRSVEWNPKDSDAWYNLGRTKYTENRFEEAIHAFEQCLLLDPKNVKAEDNLGLSYYGLGRSDDALAAYKTAIAWQSKAAQKDPEPLINLGTLYIEQNRSKDALPYLLEATQVAPRDAKAHEKLGKALLLLEELPQAQGELENAVALAPDVAGLHYMLGEVYRKEGLIDKAKIEFQRTAELIGTHSSLQTPMP